MRIVGIFSILGAVALLASCSQLQQSLAPKGGKPAKTLKLIRRGHADPSKEKKDAVAQKEGEGKAEAATTEKETADIVPTAEQQQAARDMFKQDPAAPAAATTSAPAAATTSAPAAKPAVTPEPSRSRTGGAPATVAAPGNRQAVPDPVVLPDIEDPPVPGGRGLRIRNLAPPEEAASSGEKAAPRPNSVEKRGLRSPSLPKGLPMDVNGKLTPNNR